MPCGGLGGDECCGGSPCRRIRCSTRASEGGAAGGEADARDREEAGARQDEGAEDGEGDHESARSRRLEVDGDEDDEGAAHREHHAVQGDPPSRETVVRLAPKAFDAKDDADGRDDEDEADDD